MEYNIYCDESCHLEHDNSNVMVLGAVWCPRGNTKQHNLDIRKIKIKYNLDDRYEFKWTKISKNHYQLYNELINYFFVQDDLHFRGVIIPDKSILQHNRFNQTHDKWYYKMFFTLFNNILIPDQSYKIFIDYKDTQGGQQVKKLHEVICNSLFDFSKNIVTDIQLVNSKQVELIQLADVITGAICYTNRNLNTNQGKEEVIKNIKEKSGYTLTLTTLYKAPKINLLVWQPACEAEND